MKPITSFSKEYSFLSNFYPSTFIIDGKVYPTAEHYYQAMKAYSEVEQEAIRLSETPSIAKARGRVCNIRSNWDEFKIKIMEGAISYKLQQNQCLLDKLVATEDALLVEGNTWHDNYWGNCTCTKCIDKPGYNHLGLLLMDYRSTVINRKVYIDYYEDYIKLALDKEGL